MHDMHLEGLDLTQIRLVAELLRTRSVSAAAQSIGLSQSAASHALAKLRKRLSDPLFIRTGNGFQPTPYGERVAVAARESLDVLEAGLSSNRPFEPATTTRRFTFFTSDIGQMVIVPNLFELLIRRRRTQVFGSYRFRLTIQAPPWLPAKSIAPLASSTILCRDLSGPWSCRSTTYVSYAPRTPGFAEE